MKSKLKIISSMLIFGSIGIFVKYIKLPSLEIAFLRAVIGSLFLLCSGLIMKQKISFKLIKENIIILFFLDYLQQYRPRSYTSFPLNFDYDLGRYIP